MRYPTILIVALLALPAASAHAADARVGVHPRHGEMVLLRDVNVRHAYRKVPPSFALIVDPTPNRQLEPILGTGEMSDDEFASLSSGSAVSMLNAPIDKVGNTLSGAGFGGSVTAGGAMGGTLAGTLGGVGSTVNGATRGIGSTVNRALSQMPFGSGKAGGP